METACNVREQISPAHWECVQHTVADLFHTMLGQALQPCEEEGNTATGEVLVATIALVGHIEWLLFMGLPREAAGGIVSRFAGFEIPFDSSDMGDAVGELANILAGHVKAKLDAIGVKADISLPSVMRAQNIHVLVHRGASMAKIIFQCALGRFWVGVVSGRGPGFVA